ncbi:hypothetical protein MLD38_001929 [Melastoma candidum]|nr:hypothetical protein MLD38_001929 [Melastoma candidum]
MLGGESSIHPGHEARAEEGATRGEDQAGWGQTTSRRRWPREETLALIRVRSEMDVAFRDSSAKGPLWEDVSR